MNPSMAGKAGGETFGRIGPSAGIGSPQTVIMRADALSKAICLSPVTAGLWGERAERTAALKDALRLESRRRLEAGREADFVSNLIRAINTSKEHEATFRLVLARICEWTGWGMAGTWTPGIDQVGLEHGAAWYPETEVSRKFFRQSRRSGLDAVQGLPGRVWRQREMLWISDLRLEDRSAWGQHVAAAGFRAALGIPVSAGDEFYAVLVFFIHEPRVEDRHLAQVVEVAGVQLGNLIRMKRMQEALHRCERQLTATQRLARLGSWEWELALDRFQLSAELLSVLRLDPAAGAGRLSDFILRVHADDRAATRASLWQALRDRKAFSFEHRMICGDGVARLVRSQGEVIVEKGKPSRVAGFCQDITRVKNLEARVLEISEREQRRIGQDLHDGLSQQLVSISYLAQGLLTRLRSSSRPEAEEAARIVELIAEAGEQVRSVARGLVPVRPEPNGLVAALRRLVATVESTCAARCVLKCRARVGTTDDGVATHLYRIAQEAVTNAVRHANARRILVQMYRDREGLHLVVEDDGMGMPSDEGKAKGMGVETMEYRAKAINAQLSLRSEPGRGTRLHCCLPSPRRRINATRLP